MTAREYLSLAFHIDQRINSKLSQVMRLRATAAICTRHWMKPRHTPMLN